MSPERKGCPDQRPDDKRNIAIAAGADADEVERVATRLKEAGHVRVDIAEKILAEMRA